MEENGSASLDYEASFDAALEGILGGDSETADQPEGERTEEEAVGGAGGEEKDEPVSEGEAAEGADQPVEGAEPEKFHLKWMDEERDVTKDEIVPLAQKGLDYDRIRGKYDDLKTKSEEQAAYLAKYKDTLEDLEDFMSENDLGTMGEVLDAMRIAKLTQKGINREVAAAQVKQSRAERALDRMRKQQEAKQEETKKESKAQADLRAFMKDHPEEDLKELLPKLQADLEQTGDLEVSYLRWSLREARKEAEAAKAAAKAEQKNADKKKRAPGSMQSAGGGTDGVFEALSKIVLSD